MQSITNIWKFCRKLIWEGKVYSPDDIQPQQWKYDFATNSISNQPFWDINM